MTKSSRILRAFALVGTLPLAAMAQGANGDRIDTTLTIDQGGLVQLGVVSGEIRVSGSNRQDVKLVATIERGRFELSATRSRVALQTRSLRDEQSAAFVDVQVPVGTRVTATSVSGLVEVRATLGEIVARSVSGRVEVQGGRARVDVQTVSGALDVRDIQGRMSIEAVSASIEVEGAVGDLTAETVSGGVRLRRSQLSGLHAKTVSGSISYDGALSPSGTYRLNTHSGSVTLTLPADVGATLELDTFSGRIVSDFPLTLQPGQTTGRGRRMEFTLGNGGARVTAGAFSGNINIRRRGQ